jgi:hypothetical protein
MQREEYVKERWDLLRDELFGQIEAAAENLEDDESDSAIVCEWLLVGASAYFCAFFLQDSSGKYTDRYSLINQPEKVKKIISLLYLFGYLSFGESIEYRLGIRHQINDWEILRFHSFIFGGDAADKKALLKELAGSKEKQKMSILMYEIYKIICDGRREWQQEDFRLDLAAAKACFSNNFQSVLVIDE